MARLEGFTKGPKAYTSVQCGRGANDHIELNTDLVYCNVLQQIHHWASLTRGLDCSAVNHSCEPNVALDLSSPDTSNWHLRALRRIEPGETRKPSPSFEKLTELTLLFSGLLLPEHRVGDGPAIRLSMWNSSTSLTAPRCFRFNPFDISTDLSRDDTGCEIFDEEGTCRAPVG